MKLASIILDHPRYTRMAMLTLAFLALAAVNFLAGPSLLVLEEQLGAEAWRFNSDSTPEERINIIAIDERSIERLGAWPWSRETMARLSSALESAGVQLQLYDIVFPESQPGDSAFAQALGSNAVLAQVPVLDADQSVTTGMLGSSVTGVDCQAGAVIPQAQNYLGNNPSLAGIAKGHITPRVDGDGGIRKVPALICVDGKAYPSLALSALLQALQVQDWQVRLTQDNSLLGPAYQLTIPAYPGFAVPLDSDGNFRVNYRRDPAAFRAFSAVDVIEGTIPAGALTNSWALVGYSAFGLVDSVATPYSGAAAGVEIQARIIASMLDAAIPHTPRNAQALLLALSLIFAAGLLGVASLREKAAFTGLALAALALPALALLLHIELLTRANLWLGWLNPALYALMGAALLVMHELIKVRFERSRVMHNLAAYLPGQLASEIAYRLPDSEISARRQNVTLLSADLRNFSAYTEACPPEESATILHAFFTSATDILATHGGQVFEFRGDGLLAYWESVDSASVAQALDAAAAIEAALQSLLDNTGNHPRLEPLALGIGIEAGPVLIGSIGSARRRTPTLLGETVTIAMRIQDMTCELAQPILLGESAARQVPERELLSQGSYLLDGLQTPHTLFAPEQSEEFLAQSNISRLRLLQGGKQ